MKVKDLQERLSKFDPDMNIVCYSDNSDLLSNNRDFILFDISSLEEKEAETTRLDDGKPYLKFGKSAHAGKIALIEVTPDF